jgi:GTPase SAR1 family protein
VVTTIPTIGFNVETIEYKKIKFTTWAVGGGHKIRPLWRHQGPQGAQGLIFVVDSSNMDRIDEAHDFLGEILGEMRGAAVLVLANKSDLPSAAMPADELATRLGVKGLAGRQWRVPRAAH